MTKYHDALVKPRHFNIGDLVLKRISLATEDPAHGKLGPNWEGLYRVINSKRVRIILLRSLGWMEVGTPMEYGAFEEVLPVKATC